MSTTSTKAPHFMYGKSFASMYTGSMFGQSALVFAVWGYCITNQKPSKADGESYVELNPTLLASMFSESVDNVTRVLEFLESPDPNSRTKLEGGRRLVRQDSGPRHAGPMQYRVVNGAYYRKIRDEEERREYLRLAQQKTRAKKKSASTASTDVNTGLLMSAPSTQSEADGDVEKEASQNSEAGSRALTDLTREDPPPATRFAVPEVTVADVAREWHAAAPFGVMHGSAGWASDFNDIAITINTHQKIRPTNRARVLQKLCLWVWRDPEGPHVSGRLKKVDPRKIAKRCSTDIDSAVASEWVARWLDGLEQERAV